MGNETHVDKHTEGLVAQARMNGANDAKVELLLKQTEEIFALHRDILKDGLPQCRVESERIARLENRVDKTPKTTRTPSPWSFELDSKWGNLKAAAIPAIIISCFLGVAFVLFVQMRQVRAESVQTQEIVQVMRHYMSEEKNVQTNMTERNATEVL